MELTRKFGSCAFGGGAPDTQAKEGAEAMLVRYVRSNQCRRSAGPTHLRLRVRLHVLSRCFRKSATSKLARQAPRPRPTHRFAGDRLLRLSTIIRVIEDSGGRMVARIRARVIQSRVVVALVPVAPAVAPRPATRDQTTTPPVRPTSAAPAPPIFARFTGKSSL